ADEPTGSLDSATGTAIMGLFRRLHASGRTVIVVTHDPRVANLAERQIHLLDGRIVLDAPTDQVRSGAAVPVPLVVPAATPRAHDVAPPASPAT
ncbi:MAG: macrolide ABC transporter permease/ATP-binding protein MacB, partial [Chloroflexi bacterium]|nr:macrolide ABC transporter permease/ATP-binding protein MacB [Chloroflexota bacterium]